MERRSLGSFLAALRKARGMTQKELAEKLNVTDKSVSRWEREESYPDLALIPVIAEIFGITSDELLRGERRSAGEPEPERSAGRTAKQRQRLLNAGKARYRNQSLVALGVGLVGLLGALVCNFGFNRAYVGFFAGAAFYLAAAICQAVFVNGACFAIKDEELVGPDVEDFKWTVFNWVAWVFGVLAVLLSITLPLITCVHDAYCGLAMDSWLGFALLYGGVGALIAGGSCDLLKSRLLKNGSLTLEGQKYALYRHNHRLRRRCVLILAVVLAVSFFTDQALTGFGDPLNAVRGEVFENFEDFKAYMEQDIPWESAASSSGHASAQVAPETDGTYHYYDEDGNEITEDEYRTRTLEDREGNVIGTYVDRNESVIRLRYGSDIFPITVYTEAHQTSATIRAGTIHVIFLMVYVLEAFAVTVFYFAKGKKK